MKKFNKRKRFRLKRINRDLKILLKNKNTFFKSMIYVLNVIFKPERRLWVTLDGERILIRCNTPDLQTAHRCLTTEFSEVLELADQRHQLIIDAGGHIGAAAIAFARAFSHSTVVCIEPHPDNYEIACANTKEYPNVIVLNAALTAEPGTIGLFDRGTGNWGYTILDKPLDVETPTGIGEVKCVTVQQIIQEYEKTGIDIMKLDVEGAEREILENSASWMQDCELLLAELHDRIISGCIRVYIKSTEGRFDMPSKGEKFISMRRN